MDHPQNDAENRGQNTHNETQRELRKRQKERLQRMKLDEAIIFFGKEKYDRQN